MRNIVNKIIQVVIPVSLICVVTYYISTAQSLISDAYMGAYLAAIAVLCAIFLATVIKYKRYISSFCKSIFLPENIQSMELLEMLDRMVVKLDHRDNVLIQEKEHAVAANSAKSDFLVGISHELRTPMHAILNFADMGKISTQKSDPEKVATCFTRIEDSGERLLSLINGLLDLTKLESGKVTFKFKENNMLECINYVSTELSPLLTKKALTIEIKQRNPINNLKFDKEHMIRVLVNMISNAINFSPNDSNIVVVLDYGRYKIDEKNKVKGLKVSVEDNGPGLNEDEKDALFNKFIQGTKKLNKAPSGSGLGLAICREIISAHHGSIWLENKTGGGARVNFIIPG